jgi:hypothetical protein
MMTLNNINIGDCLKIFNVILIFLAVQNHGLVAGQLIETLHRLKIGLKDLFREKMDGPTGGYFLQ